MSSSSPTRPRGVNILITGTPGTGKSSLAQMLVDELADMATFTHIEVGDVVKEHRFYTAYDAALDTHIIDEDDEDRLLDHLEPILGEGEGNNIVTYHASGLFPRRWFHLVVVLRTATEVLYDRLTARRYCTAKREENMEAEIQCVCEEEARESYDDAVVLVRENNTLDDMSETVSLVRRRVAALLASRQQAQQQ